MATHKDGLIYFLHMKGTDFYKVGWVKRIQNLKPRIAKFQTGNPITLEVMGLIHGSLKDERKLHWKMASSMVGGEWFQDKSLLRSLIENSCPPDFF